MGAVAYLVYINFSATGSSILTMEEIKDDINKSPGDCWVLEDNRTVCYFGESTVAPGELIEADAEVKLDATGGGSSGGSASQKNIAEDGSEVLDDYWDDANDTIPLNNKSKCIPLN